MASALLCSFFKDFYFQAFVKQGHKFSGRPVSAFINQFTYGLGVSTRDYDEHWKIQRKFGLVTLRGCVATNVRHSM